AVQNLFTLMPRNVGATPPQVDGRYHATGTVTFSTMPGIFPGNTADNEFCLGPSAGAALEVAVLDPTVVDGGALSFIEGSGNLFTVYTAFKLVQAGPNGGTCEIHEVMLSSGRSEADGSLTSLFIGSGVMGLVGDCGGLI